MSQLDDIENSLDQLHGSVRRIEDCLLGDKMKSQKGLIDRVERLEEKDKRKWKVPTWLLKVFGFG